MQKAELHPLAIDHKLGGPGNRDSRAERRHLDNAALRTLLEETDIAVMRQDARPLRKIGGGLEDRLARSVHDDRVAGLHGSRRKRGVRISCENRGAMDGREYGAGNS